MTSETSPTFDRAAAIEFLLRSRSRFVKDAGIWLTNFDDNADLLFSLAGDVGQNLGPWESFRLCSILGLTTSSAVIELARDVLSETPPPMNAAPISAVFSLAHAMDTLRDDDAPNLPLFISALEGANVEGEQDAHAIACAGYALGNLRKESLIDDVMKDDFAALATLSLEAALLREDFDLAAAALRSLGTHQDEDGAIACEARHPVFRGMATLRAVAMSLRYASSQELAMTER